MVHFIELIESLLGVDLLVEKRERLGGDEEIVRRCVDSRSFSYEFNRKKIQASRIQFFRCLAQEESIIVCSFHSIKCVWELVKT